MESKIFSWESWEQFDDAVQMFHNIQFKVDFGPYKKGDKRDYCLVDYENGEIAVYSDSETEYAENIIKCKIVVDE